MTDSKENAENSEDPAQEETSQHEASEQESPATEEPASAETVEHPEPDAEALEDELPEEEELTPELVEEEAIRGDFMLRWATIFLAVLFGFSQMADTRTLVHIRSGDHMRANGFLPSGDDVLSHATEGRSVSNVSWLFDHIVSFVFATGGASGLTIFKALVAGLIAYVLSLVSVRGMPTWWSSVCCAFAVAACSIDFLPLTDLMTLLGLALTLLWLHRYDDEGDGSLWWKMPVLTLLWANLDPRAWIGVTAVVLFAVGAKLRQSQSLKAGDSPGSDVSVLWKAAALSVVALLVNPSPLASLLSPLTIYTVEYPGMALMKPVLTGNGRPMDAASLLDGRTEYWQLWVPEVFRGFELAYLSGLSLIVIAIVVLTIGRSRSDLPWAVTLGGFSLLAAIALHELPAASLVAAATAGVVAQRWYSRTFRQEYSIDTAEVLFSRGGRAVTVFAMAILAFFVVADRLPTRTAVGLGFDPDLAATMQSLGEELAEIPDDAAILNTRMAQGDLLIWHGRQSFVDSRVVPFGRPGDPESLISRFDSLRKSLLIDGDEPDPGMEIVEDPARNPNWPEEYAAFDLSRVMIRLAPPGPAAYPMVRAFEQSGNWMLTERGASAAYFAKVEQEEASDEEAFDILEMAFQQQGETVDSVARIDYGRESDFYSTYVYAKRPKLSVSHRAAQHFFSLDSQFSQQTVLNLAIAAAGDPSSEQYRKLLGRTLAGPLLTIRNANQSLSDDPQNASAYRLLGMAYLQLRGTEAAIVGAFGGASPDSLRYMQAVMALRQAVLIEPDHADSWSQLIGLYETRGRTDLALECLEKYLALVEDEMFQSGPEGEEQLRQMHDTRQGWTDQRDEVLAQVEDVMASDQMPEDPQQNAMQKLAFAQQLSSQGYVRVALDLMNDNLDLLRAVPQAEVLRGSILLEVGDLEDGFQVLNQFAGFARENKNRPDFAGIEWHTPVALSQLGKSDYETAKSAWNDKVGMFVQADREVPQLLQMFSQTLPLTSANRLTTALPHWPVMMLQSAQFPVGAIQQGKAEPLFMMAIADLEAGRINDARRGLTDIVSDAGETPFRPLAIVYLSQLSDDAQAVINNSILNPWEAFTYPEDTDNSSDSPAEAKTETSDTAPEDAAPKDADSKDADPGSKQKTDDTDTATKSGTPDASATVEDKETGASDESGS